MKLLVLDNNGAVGVDLALRAQDAGHSVRYWATPKHDLAGTGMLQKPKEWEPSMEWAELIVLTGNSKYEETLAPYFGKGYPIFGANARSAELELDREVGQKVLLSNGVPILPYKTVRNLDEAIDLVCATRKAYAIKPWGGTADKAMTCVARDCNEAIFMLSRWKAAGLNGQLMLQEKADGVEMGIAGWFGPGGWSAAIEESFEHKKFLVGDLGCNTGEMGTVIRHVKKSKLFEMVLEPVTEYLHSVNYVGDCSINCIIDDDGTAWPLEFTCRLGWPDFCIRQAVIESDPVEWMADLLYGKDSLQVSTEVAVGVLIAHGDFPDEASSDEKQAGYPISGVTSKNYKHLHFQQVMDGKVPAVVGGKVERVASLVSAGNYLMVVTGTGNTVSRAAEQAYHTAWDIKMPSNVMFRTDIGTRLEEDLPKLQENGYATGMKY